MKEFCAIFFACRFISQVTFTLQRNNTITKKNACIICPLKYDYHRIYVTIEMRALATSNYKII